MKPKGDKKTRPMLEGARRLRRNRNEDPDELETSPAVSPPSMQFARPSGDLFNRMSVEMMDLNPPQNEDLMSVCGSSTSVEMKDVSNPNMGTNSAGSGSTVDMTLVDQPAYNPDRPNVYAYRNPIPLTVPSETSLTGSTSTTISEGLNLALRSTISDPMVSELKHKLQTLDIISPDPNEPSTSTSQFPDDKFFPELSMIGNNPTSPYGMSSYPTPQLSFEESARIFQERNSPNLNLGNNVEIRGRWQDLFQEEPRFITLPRASEEVEEIRPRTRHGRDSLAIGEAPSCVNLMAALEEEGRGDEGDHNQPAASLPLGSWYLRGHRTRNVGLGPLEGNGSNDDFLSDLHSGPSKKRKSEFLGNSDEEDYEDDESDNVSDLYSRIAELENEEGQVASPATRANRKRKGDKIQDDTNTPKKPKERGRRSARGRESGSESD